MISRFALWEGTPVWGLDGLDQGEGRTRLLSGEEKESVQTMSQTLRSVATSGARPLSPADTRLLEIMEEHSRAERSADIEAVMETVSTAPVWEFGGRCFEGRDSVRRFYEAFIKHLGELAPLEYRSVVFGEETVATEFAWIFNTANGGRSYPASAVMAFDGERLQAERIYCAAPELLAIVDGWLEGDEGQNQ